MDEDGEYDEDGGDGEMPEMKSRQTPALVIKPKKGTASELFIDFSALQIQFNSETVLYHFHFPG